MCRPSPTLFSATRPFPVKPTAYFFDLGGTLVALDHERIACDATGRVTLLPGVKATLTALRGELVFVITNQAGVALGELTEREARGYLDQVNEAVHQAITDYWICMHHPRAGCVCRKPQPGMVLELASIHAIDLSQALLIGDTLVDQQCARQAGIRSFLWAAEFFPQRAR